MSDEDGGRTSGDEDGGRTSGDEDDGFSLQLPPLDLPPLFPEDFRILWPGGGDRPGGRVSLRIVVVAVVAFDLLDAFLAVTVDPTANAAVVTAARTVGGALLAATMFGPLGLPYLWEPVAALLGFGQLTAVPTLSVLLLARVLR
jgi:hypothetical protein